MTTRSKFVLSALVFTAVFSVVSPVLAADQRCAALSNDESTTQTLQAECNAYTPKLQTLLTKYNNVVSSFTAKFNSLSPSLRKHYSKVFKADLKILAAEYKKSRAALSKKANKVCAAAGKAQTVVVSLQQLCSTNTNPDPNPGSGLNYPVTPAEIDNTVENADHKSQLALVTFNENSLYWAQEIVEQLMTFKMPEACWTQFLDPEFGGQKLSFETRYIAEYQKALGFGDPDAVESANGDDGADRLANSPQSKAIVDSWVGEIHESLWIDPTISCDNAEFKTLGEYYGLMNTIIQDGLLPKSGVLFLTMVFTPRVSVISVLPSADGKTLYVYIPSEVYLGTGLQDLTNALAPYFVPTNIKL